jgi:HSP20 family protein
MFRNDWFGRFPFFEAVPDAGTLFDRLLQERPVYATRAYPPLNVREDPDRIEVMAEIPGIDPNTLDVKVQDNTLLIRGSRTPDEEGGKLLRRERQRGAFQREVALPAKVDHHQVEAEYRLGILTITMPKAAEARPHVIKIKSA